MKAIILSAGQGRRLLPLTEKRPKCLLSVQGDATMLEHQLRTLASAGIDEAVVVIGFESRRVEQWIHAHPVPGIHVRTAHNPFFAYSDNLASAWLVRREFDDDFLLLNGDTLFEPAVLSRLVAPPHAALRLAISRKRAYDADDMKVALDGDGRLEAVGKQLAPEAVDAESIGLMRFRGDGAAAFARALDGALRRQGGLGDWYLSAIDAMAGDVRIETADVSDLWWAEIDSAEDLHAVRAALGESE